MVNQVEWSVKAEDTFDAIIAYLEKDFTYTEVRDFVNRTYEKLDIIRAFPRIGTPAARKRNVYRTLIHKKVTLVYYYRPIKKEIILVTFWNNLQDPAKLKY